MHSEYVTERQMAQDHGHDSLVQDIAIDTLAKTVAIRLLSHPDSRTRRRVPLELLFQQVEAVTVDADIITLRVEEGVGTVDHWHLADAAGASHIHMAKGHVSVAARIAPELIRLRA